MVLLEHEVSETDHPIISLFLMLFCNANILYISPASGLHHGSLSGALKASSSFLFFFLSIKCFILWCNSSHTGLSVIYWGDSFSFFPKAYCRERLSMGCTESLTRNDHFDESFDLLFRERDPVLSKSSICSSCLHRCIYERKLSRGEFCLAPQKWSVCRRDYNLHLNIIHNLPSTI